MLEKPLLCADDPVPGQFEQGKNIFMRYFVESSEVRADSVAASFVVTRTIGELYELFDSKIKFRASISPIFFITTVIFPGPSIGGASLMAA